MSRAVATWLESRDDEECAGIDVHETDSDWVKADSDPLVDGKLPSNEPPLRFLIKILFAFSDVGCVGFAAIMGFYLNPFLLEVAGVSPEAVGIILLAAKLVDAVSDPLIGFLSDRTRTRWGRRKVWVAIAFLPAFVAYAAIWLVPPFDSIGKVAYYVCLLVFFSASVSAVTLPINALAPELTNNYDERTSVMVWRVLALSLITILGTFVQSLLVTAFDYTPEEMTHISLNGTGCSLNVSYVNGTVVPIPNEAVGYIVSGVAFAIFAVPFILLLLFCVPEKKIGKKKRPVRRDGSVRHPQYTVWQSLKTMLTNRGFVCVTLIYLTSQLSIQFVQNNMLLYIK